MPSPEKTESIQSTSVEQTPDFDDLQKQKEELFRELAAQSLELDVDEKTSIATLVSGFSMKDGFEMAKTLGVQGFDYLLALAVNDNVRYKNKDFYKKFQFFLNENKKFLHLTRVTEGVIDNFDMKKGVILPSSHPSEFYNMGQHPDPSRDTLTKIESYYSHFVRNRRVASPEIPAGARTQIEQAGEEHLISTEAMLKESYYTGPIRRYFGIEDDIELQSELDMASEGLTHRSGARNATTDEVWALRRNLIDRKTLDSLFESDLAKGLTKDDPQFQKVLRHARYAPTQVVFETRKEAVEKGLVRHITESLIKRGFKENEFEVTFNKEKGEYSVMDKKGQVIRDVASPNEKNKENIRALTEIPHRFEMKPGDPYYENMKSGMNSNEIDSKTGVTNLFVRCEVVGDGIYKTIQNRQHDTFIEYPDGSRSKIFFVIQNIEKIEGHDYFITNASDGGRNNFQICRDGERINENDTFQSSGDYTVSEDGSIYWCGIDGSNNDRWYIFKNDHIEFSFEDHERLYTDLCVFGDKVAIVTKQGLQDSGPKKLRYGDEQFGPYDDIKLCKNSKDKLIFYAKKGDESFVYLDGKEKRIVLNDNRPYKMENILLTDSGPVLFYSLRDKYYSRYDVATSYEEYVDNHLTNICEIDGKPFYIADSGNDGETRIHWVNCLGVKIKFESKKYHTVVGFNGRAFISDDKRIVSLRSGPEADDPDLKEMTFEGEVKIINSGGRLFIIESLTDRERVWEYSDGLKLNEIEQKDLDLANAVAKENLPAIDGYFKKWYPEEEKKSPAEKIKSGIRTALEQSKGLVGAVNQTIKEAPELFMDTLRAKNDKPTEYFMTQMFYYMFPQAQVPRERAIAEQKRNRKSSWNIFGGGNEGGRGGRSETVNYDPGIDRLASVDEAGYYDMLKANREILKLREPLPPSTFITQGLFGNYTGSGWTKVNVPISQEVHDPAKETTFEFIDEKASRTINLPKIANARIISERLKGITTRDEEVPIEILEENNLGEVRVDKGELGSDKDIKRITYSQTYSEMPTTMAEVTTNDYDRFRKDFEKSFGDVMTKPLGDIGDELDMFARGLKGKSPREQVIAIQEFCYEYGYYNLDNQPRDTDSFEERLSIMEGRMDDLKAKDPALAHKLYAGICTDFATLTAGLLRRVGLVSGIASGFVPEAGSTVVKTSRAHAVSYVLWPNPGNKGGKPDMIIVDGTPSSITPRILEQEKKAVEMSGELGGDAEKEFAELERILQTMDVGAIKKLENGKLEKTLNHILSGVKQSHVDMMDRVLNASRYGSFDVVEMARGCLDDQIEFRKFLEEEIIKEKSSAHDIRERRGEELFDLIQDFTRRFEKDKRVGNKEGALDVIEKIFDSSDKYLDPIETRSAAAILTYLRARKMR